MASEQTLPEADVRALGAGNWRTEEGYLNGFRLNNPYGVSEKTFLKILGCDDCFLFGQRKGELPPRCRCVRSNASCFLPSLTFADFTND
jgi:hypothetical protein